MSTRLIEGIDKCSPFLDNFYSLCKNKGERKKRKCLRCFETFVSIGVGNRICGSCNQTNSRLASQEVLTDRFISSQEAKAFEMQNKNR